MAELFVTNILPGPVAQKLYAKADGSRATRVSKLARVGNCGQAKNSMHRDLMRKQMKGCTFPEPYWCLGSFSQQREWIRGITLMYSIAAS